MLEFEGKYNTAKVMIDAIDESTVAQIYTFLNHPAFEGGNIVIMPDCHAGAGTCIGFTMTMNDKIVPGTIGVDVGCGLLACNLGKRKKWKKHRLERLDGFIRENIPAIEWADGSKEWFLNGQRLSEDEHRQKTQKSQVKEMTVKEISEALGCEIKVVKE